jgi:hypothetical protein
LDVSTIEKIIHQRWHPFSIFNFEPVWIIQGKYKIVSAPRPHRPPSDSGRRRIARAHGFISAVSRQPFQPSRAPSSTASCGFKRSAPSKELHLSFFFFCSRPAPELCPRAPPLCCPASQASVASSVRRHLEPLPPLLFPSRRTPPVVKLHWLPSRSIDATPTTAHAPATVPNHELPTTTTGRCPSPPFLSDRAAPPWKPPLW